MHKLQADDPIIGYVLQSKEAGCKPPANEVQGKGYCLRYMLGRERRERGRREKQTDREGEGRSEKQKKERERERGGITGVFINRSTHTCNNVNVGTLECIRG